MKRSRSRLLPALGLSGPKVLCLVTLPTKDGWTAMPGVLLKYRKAIGAGHIQIFTEIKKKHSSHAATADITLSETAIAAEFFLSDGFIVTGHSTGHEADVEEVGQVKNATALPVIIGSGITVENLPVYWPYADAFIVGSSLKKDGLWFNPPDEGRISELMKQVGVLKKKILRN
jgi:predicted TIM-barrel enzyme